MKSKEVLQKQCEEIIQALNTLKEDDGVPKNVRTRIDSIIDALREDTDISMKVGNSLHNLDDISEDLNLPAFIRTQVWNISSMLEKLNQ